MADEDVSPGANRDPNADRIAELERQNAELQRRYAASSEEGKRLAQLNQQLQQSRQIVPQRAATARDTLAEWGVPPDALEEVVNEKIGAAIQRAFQPITEGFKARNEMLAKYPDFGKFEADVASFVHNDPETSERYQKLFQVDPVAANEYAYLKFGAQEQKKPRARGANTREESAHAAIPTERAGEARRTPQENQELADAMEDVRKSGRSRDAVDRYAKLRLKQAISDQFLNQ